MKILVLNGPNINMLGIREPDVYGKNSFADLLTLLQVTAEELQIEVEQYQSNHEGCLVDKIQEAYGNVDGIVINPAAYTHTSVAILDALKSVSIPAVEVHLSDVSAREDFRQVSYAGMACLKTYAGFGFDGYRMAAEFLKEQSIPFVLMGTSKDKGILQVDNDHKAGCKELVSRMLHSGMTKIGLIGAGGAAWGDWFQLCFAAAMAVLAVILAVEGVSTLKKQANGEKTGA